MKNELIYLASPYNDKDESVRQKRFEDVCQAASALMRQGYIIYSPIAHNHPLVKFGLPTGWDYWERYDSVFLKKCDELWVLMLPGWKKSTGVKAEIKIALDKGMPVVMLDPETLEFEA